MIRVMDDMPPGTLGVEAAGEVTAEDYRPLYVLDSDFSSSSKRSAG